MNQTRRRQSQRGAKKRLQNVSNTITIQTTATSQSVVNKIFLTMDKDNAQGMFGYRIRFLPNKKQVYKEPAERVRQEFGMAETKTVNYRYE